MATDGTSDEPAERASAPVEELRDENRLLAVANELLADELSDRRRELDSLRRLGEEFSATLDLDVLVDRMLEEAAAATDVEAAALLVRQGDDVVLEDARHPGRPHDHVDRLVLRPCARGLVAEAIATNAPVQRQAPDGGCVVETELASALGVVPSAALAIPLASAAVGGGAALGVLLLVDGRPRAGFLDGQVAEARHIASIAALAYERTRLVRTMILRMVAMAELRDPHETGAHVRRVAGISVAILAAWARRTGLGRDETKRMRDLLYVAALLHDIGKVGVPDAILSKPGALDAPERRAMERHTVVGAGLFQGLRTDVDDAARDVVLRHHERWDGAGYPDRLGCESIPLFARIVAAADVFDALSSPRAYKPAWAEERVLEHLRGEAGRHFDPLVVECLMESLPAVRRVQRRFAEAPAAGA